MLKTPVGFTNTMGWIAASRIFAFYLVGGWRELYHHQDTNRLIFARGKNRNWSLSQNVSDGRRETRGYCSACDHRAMSVTI